jgi:16S rRNA (cytidine1402-2'-O)-methyltransferase
MNDKPEPALYLVPTPIGNLDDITLRAIKILSAADYIACEDTRHTGNLLKLLKIEKKRFISYHEHNETEKSKELIELVKNGSVVALVTDAGTPCLSDPGYRLVSAAIEQDINIVPLPGASALLPALIGSGMAVNNFKFLGFPPQKKGRQKFFAELAMEPSTVIIYESPYKILKTIDDLGTACGADRKICLARELTKMHEEFIRGTVAECKAKLIAKQNIKGEFVVVVEGN